MTATLSRPTVPVAPSTTQQRWIPGFRGLTLIIAGFAALLSFLGSWIPSFWGDEAASILSAERPLPSLFAMLGRVDAVHGLYYFFLHFWIQAFGASEISVRFPSAIGVGLGAAGTIVLGALILNRRVGLIAGLVYAVLPRVTYMGAEGRSYALATAVGVWLTVLFVTLLRRRIVRVLLWVGYGLGLALAVYSFLYLILLVIVHGLVLFAAARTRSLTRRWICAVGLALVLCIPILIFGLGEHGQIAFLGTRPKFDPNLVFVTQWFGTVWQALLCWVLILLAIGAWMLSWRTRRPRGRLSGMLLLVAWLVLPTLLLELGNAAVAPMYTTRYLSFCTPAVALLMAAGILTIAGRWMRAATIVLLLGLTLPSYVQQRGPYAKDSGSDWSQLSAIVDRVGKPGDAITFDNVIKNSQKPRLAMRLYPQDYRGLDDIALVTPWYKTGGLWDVVDPLGKLGAQLAAHKTVIDVEMTPVTSEVPPDVLELERFGFQLLREIPVHRTTVYELSREPS